MQLDLVIAEADKLKRVVDTLSESAADTLKELTGEAFDMDMLQQDSPTQQRDEDEANEVDDAPVVKFIQKVLIDAINEGASDVHFEPYEKYPHKRVVRIKKRTTCSNPFNIDPYMNNAYFIFRAP